MSNSDSPWSITHRDIFVPFRTHNPESLGSQADFPGYGSHGGDKLFASWVVEYCNGREATSARSLAG